MNIFKNSRQPAGSVTRSGLSSFVSLEVEEIEDICRAQGQPASPLTTEDVKRAIKHLNKGK